MSRGIPQKPQGKCSESAQFRAGADPRRGRGPKKGAWNAGRPPDVWRAACRELASRSTVLERAQEVLDNPEHPAWLSVWKFVAEQGFGRAPQAIGTEEEPPRRQVFKICGQEIEF